MKSNKLLFLLVAGYILNLLVFSNWYHTPYTPIIDVIAVLAIVTVLYLLLYILILTVNSLQTPWKSFLLVSIITVSIIILIQIVYHEKYQLRRFEERKLAEEIRTVEKARIGELITKIGDATKTITVLKAMLDLKNNENDKYKRQLNKINGKMEKDAVIQPKSITDSSEIKTNPEGDNTALDTKSQEIVFKVQIISSGTRLVKTSPHFKDIKNVWEYREKGLYKYTVGNQRDLKSASVLQSEFRDKGFNGAFVVAFNNEKRISVREAKRFLN